MGIFTERLNKVFSLKDRGDLHYFLGLEVPRDVTGIVLSQKKYIQVLLCWCNMLEAKPCSTPMTFGKQLSSSQGELLENPTVYRSIVGSLKYLVNTRPGIAFSVNDLS